MNSDDHDGKCELRRRDDIVEAFGSWEEFRRLPQETRRALMARAGIDEAVSECKCARRKRNRDDFIRLWTAAGPAKNYNKDAWKDVEKQLFNVDEM